MLRIPSLKSKWVKKQVFIPTLTPGHYTFGNVLLQNYLAALKFNRMHMYDELIEKSSDEPWGEILCHLIWIQEDENTDDILQELTKSLPKKDGSIDKDYLVKNPLQGKPPVNVIRIHLSCSDLKQLTIRNMSNNFIGTKIPSALPYTPSVLRTLLLLLDEGAIAIENSEEDMQNLSSIGLINGNRVSENYLESIGKHLYNVIFSNNAIPEFTLARRNGEPVILELLFDPDDVILSQFPWELMFDGNLPYAVLNNNVYLIRSVITNELDGKTNTQKINTYNNINILSLHPRPKELSNLPLNEKKSFQTITSQNWFKWQELMPPSWGNLKDKLLENEENYNFLHFDGHGAYGKVCPNRNCRAMNKSLLTKCKNCNQDIEGVMPTGYLNFEDENGGNDRVKILDLKVILANSKVQVGVISACHSAEVDGVSIFNSVAPGLLQAGFQAVIGMQGSPTVGMTAKFMESFYKKLVHGYPIYQAVNLSRLEIFREIPPSWFMPVLYMKDGAVGLNRHE